MLPVLAGFCFCNVCRATEIEDITRLHATPQTIGIATGHEVPFNLAPAVASVITAEDLRDVGATTLSQALRLVPGINVLYRSQGDHFVFRGVRADSNFNPDWLLMLDGVPQVDVVFGNQRLFIGEVPLANIARIEVIRGPGSALYGTDAFAGVINVITVKPGEVDRAQISARAGSYDTAEARILRPDDWTAFNSLLSLQARTTEGHTPWVDEDAQTFWDRQLGTNVSLAPGPQQTWIDDYNALLDIGRGPWRMRFRQWEHQLGVAGLTGALDDVGKRRSKLQSIDAMYEDRSRVDMVELTGRLSWYKFDSGLEEVRVYPPGAFGGLFPDGVRDDPSYKEERWYGELTALYKGLSRHALLFGFGAEQNRAYDIRENRNYTYNEQGFPIPLGGVVALDESQVFLLSKIRTKYFAYVQDEWNLVPDVILTAGVRYDHFSDFGSTLNPRIALVWSTLPNVTTKLLAGRAFRAPTFIDLYGQNNPSITGNPQLEPEMITTYELAFDYRPSPLVRFGFNLFKHRIEDKTRGVQVAIGTINTNIGEQSGYGGEFEMNWRPTADLSINSWYGYQRNEVREDGSDPGYAPHHSGGLRLDWHFTASWQAGTQLRWVAGRRRTADDLRTPVDDYSSVDATLRFRPRNSAWSTTLSIFNVLAEEQRDPSDAPGALARDHLLPGRSTFLDVTWEF